MQGGQNSRKQKLHYQTKWNLVHEFIVANLRMGFYISQLQCKGIYNIFGVVNKVIFKTTWIYQMKFDLWSSSM